MPNPAIAPFLNEMRKELAQTAADFAAWIAILSSPTAGAAATFDALEAYSGQVERIGQTAELIGMPGLNSWCQHLISALPGVMTLEGEPHARACQHLLGWQAIVDTYLTEPGDFDAALGLAEYLSGPDGAQPLNPEVSLGLVEALTTPPDVPEELTAELEAAAAPATVTVADVSLQLREDADLDVFNAFMDEAPSKSDEFSQLTGLIASGRATQEDLREAKRIAHSFKGSANIVGIRGIAALGHHTEDILEYFENSAATPPRAVSASLMAAADCMAQMVAFLRGDEDAPDNSFAVLSEVVVWANKIKTGEIAEVGDDKRVSAYKIAALANAVGQAESSVDTNIGIPPVSIAAPVANTVVSLASMAEPPESRFAANTVTAPTAAATAAADPTQAKEADATLRVAVKTVDELFRLVGEMNAKIAQLETKVKSANGRAKTLLNQNLLVQQRVLDIEKLVLLRGLSLTKSDAEGQTNPDFDPLELDRYNELQGATRALVETTADAREFANGLEAEISQLNSDVTAQNTINREIQFQVIATRLLPVNSLGSRLTRNIRQTCQQTGKQAELKIIGGDILIDGDVLAQLADPLLHILRNAVDHGIEMPDVRREANKPIVGNILLEFVRQGSSILVRVKDDGKGLDYQRIREKAIERGLITESAELNQNELARLTLLPGFSTRDSVSEISGRGVGMDVVVSRLTQLKGTVDLHSDTGNGCEVLLRLQASLVTQQSLLVHAAGQMFAIPIHHIVEALPGEFGECVENQGAFSFMVRDQTYPINELAPITGFPTLPLTLPRAQIMPKVLVRTATGTIAMLVDKIVVTRELTIKTMGKFLPRVHGISGVALTGDGAVVPLLNIPELLDKPIAISAAAAEMAAAARKKARRILVVDDSLSVRKSLVQLLEDAAYEVKTANDGLEAVRELKGFAPHVICTDLEMPNMNGLELTEHLRLRPETQYLPIIMISSRSMDKHRDQAARAGVDFYVTKPYTDADLLRQISEALQKNTGMAQAA